MEQSSGQLFDRIGEMIEMQQQIARAIEALGFWFSLARGICHKYTTIYDTTQAESRFHRNPSRGQN